ncbi:tyrosine-protein kinase Fyn-like isoform X2 [Anneissia japonica]|uniref:tyrosine-protein kinase Fyn-like isoform X2 n=1 Tax=Anneissia japonica TaxID=1529436 RepID=UPI0014258B55|nr:tyrosine-protein kinase Fyn-like isoform X2 [Anneissia japonica]
MHRASYDFDAREEDELSINKGDLLEVLDKSNGPWWLVRSIRTQKEGLVPSNYIAALESNEFNMSDGHNSNNYEDPTEFIDDKEFDMSESYNANHFADPNRPIDDEDWYFGNMEGSDLDKLLIGCNLPRGTFLIRDSSSFPGQFTLSVLGDGDGVVKYSIKMRQNIGYYISKSKTFGTITELVNYYKLEANGLCCKLEMPLPKITPTTSSSSEGINWEIKIDSLKLESRIGRGRYSDIWKGKWSGRATVAIKLFLKGTKTHSAFQKEADIMKTCMHEHLVRLYAVCSENPLCMVLEYMANGSLLDYLRGNDGRRLLISDLIEIAAQISNGMAYLETKNIIHRDLRASNVLVDKHIKCKVSDFGLACELKDNKTTSNTDELLAIRWTALEILLSVGQFTIKSDIWSFGVLLSELITYGQLPYSDVMNDEQVYEKVINGYRMAQPKDCPVAIYDLMHKCWKSEPEDRPPFKLIHDFLHNYYGIS